MDEKERAALRQAADHYDARIADAPDDRLEAMREAMAIYEQALVD